MRFSEAKTLSRHKRAVRWMLFALGALSVWTAYFRWRPPAPMLGLEHVAAFPETENAIALTFDDGPHPLTTPLLLTALKRAGAPATFFVVGDGLRLYPELARRMVREGHALANHSQYHNNLTRIAPADYDAEVENCYRAIDEVYQAAGKSTTSRLFRPPGGGLNRAAMNYLYGQNVTLGWWSNNAGDWTRPPAWPIAHNVTSRLKAGDVVLLHDGGTGTPQALSRIIRTARAQGLRVLTMPER